MHTLSTLLVVTIVPGEKRTQVVSTGRKENMDADAVLHDME